MRRRLATGSHLPHLRIHTRTARAVTVQCPRPLTLEVDGAAGPDIRDLDADIVPAAFRLLV
jgi:diacylglycerol kinase family enzyme